MSNCEELLNEDYIELEIANASSFLFVQRTFFLSILNDFFVTSYPIQFMFGSLAEELADCITVAWSASFY
jgi:hypothetical protein